MSIQPTFGKQAYELADNVSHIAWSTDGKYFIAVVKTHVVLWKWNDIIQTTILGTLVAPVSCITEILHLHTQFFLVHRHSSSEVETTRSGGTSCTR